VTVAAILRGVKRAAKWITGQVRNDNSKYRFAIAAAVACIVAAALVAPLTWSAVASFLGTTFPQWVATYNPAHIIARSSTLGKFLMGPLGALLSRSPSPSPAPPSFLDALNPILIYGIVLSNSLRIRQARRISGEPCVKIVIGLALPAIVYTFTHAPVWERCFVDGVSGLISSALVIASLSYQRPQYQGRHEREALT
jgi:hypothetical protein